MEREKTKTTVKRPEVLKKLNAENLIMIERGLLGELSERIKLQNVGPVRGKPRPTELAVQKPQSLLSSCLLTVPDSPNSDRCTPSDDEGMPDLKKSFSFRQKFRLSFLSKSKEKNKFKPTNEDFKTPVEVRENFDSKMDREQKASKRFWFFRHKEMSRNDKPEVPIYKRSKSFEFLPRAIEEEETQDIKHKRLQKNSQSFVFGSRDSMGNPWGSNEGLQFLSPGIKINDDDVFTINNIKESSGSSKGQGSSVSTVSNSSGHINIMQRDSVQDLLSEFDKTVELFTENYLSDNEPYTHTHNELTKEQKRKSSSFSTLPSPKIVQLNPSKVSDISEDFKRELSRVVSNSVSLTKPGVRNSRRGSVTDWFVLEEKAAPEDKYRRALKKPTNRVRRMSSTKYWITPEECAVYSRERRPPLVIPRITQYRERVQRDRYVPHNNAQSYPEESYQEPSLKASPVRQYERLQEWSPPPDHRDDYKTSDSPRAHRMMMRSRLVGSTENLLMRRPNQLQLHLPASSSGDSLDVDLREKESAGRTRKSRSMVQPKYRVRSPIPVPRMLLPGHPIENTYPGPFQASVVHEGFVKRTKFSEGGKKCKKNWIDCYMILTSAGLNFYKDQKTYYVTKHTKAGAPPSPTDSRADLYLLNAHIVHCLPTHTRRHSRSLLLTVGYDQFLIQDETDDGAKRWFNRIQSVIYKLGPVQSDDFPTPQSQSSNTDQESIGRTPPPPHRSKPKSENSSNEDLSDEKSDVRSRLRKFFAKRQTMEALIKKGIYKDEPVFGQNLADVCPDSPPRVPVFVVHCIKEIERCEENMCTDGLYRASGNLSQVQKIRLEIDQNNLNVIENNPDIHVLTGSLKLFFRELKEPLIPCSFFERVLNACSVKPRDARIKEFREIVNSLPECNRDTLKYLLEHLLRVTHYSERNRMHTANLAIVFGPTLLWAPADKAHNIAVDCIQQNNVVDILLTDFREIFADNNNKIKKKP